MLGVDPTEFIIILVIMLIVLGPERLPEIARQAGRLVRTARQMYANVRADMGPEFDDFERGVRDLRSLNPREQVRTYSRNLIDNVQAEVPEIKQIANPPKLNVDQAARNLLRDEALDTPIGERASQSSSNGHTPPATGAPAADGTDHYE